MKFKILSNPKTENIIVFLLMALFLYASILKLSDYLTFRVQISRSPMIMAYANILAWLVPLSEIVAATLLFIPRTRCAGFILSFSIMFSFTVYISLMMIFSPWLPCSCGGIIDKMGWTGHLIFNTIFTLLSLLGIIGTPSRNKNKQFQFAQLN